MTTGSKPDAYPANPVHFAVPFHLTGTLSGGLKIPKWVAPQACTLKLGRAIANAGTGIKYQVYVNGSAPSGMVDSGAVTTVVSTHDFTDVAIAAGDYVQINVTNAGSGGQDLSVTLDGVWRT